MTKRKPTNGRPCYDDPALQAAWDAFMLEHPDFDYGPSERMKCPNGDDMASLEAVEKGMEKPMDWPEPEATDKQREMLQAAISRLRVPDRMIIQMHLDGLTQQEIADVMNRERSTIAKAIQRITEVLKSHINNNHSHS